MMDRKAMVRDYKETARPMGVYRVWNPVTGTSLVAASLDLPAILNRHRAQLKMGAHPTTALQAEWNAGASADFVFEVLDTLAPANPPVADPIPELQALEAMWLEQLGLVADRMHTLRSRRIG
ncbi:MAG: GIY-YIG nuclease family protein [Gemmatimonadetes bacterium]|nr:GIY-YIG nuclease family protein [Gemmatimonadota bacterium]MBL0177650.1 GIY-YIG nuclease family protein [Gemmatimonadota bacterium]